MKFFCCTNNLTGCKIVGGVQIALNVIFLIISVMAISAANAHANAYHNAYQHGYSYNHATAVRDAVSFATILVAVFFGGGILCGILLVVGASKRSATMLMVWIVLNGICIGWDAYKLFKGLMTTIEAKYLIGYLAFIGLDIWAELIAIGARQDVKKSGANIA